MRLLAVIGLNSGCGLGPCAAAEREVVGGVPADGRGPRGASITGGRMEAISD
jgi:hypothetical protein